jgi:mannose-1-phosphate guanylyltransferase/mannose-6-phosphate isomerase
MKVIILAGGGGTRLFPLSRTKFPKQFLKLGGELSLLAQTVKRFLPLVSSQDIVIVTNREHLHQVKAELAAVGSSEASVLLEPVGRNTAPAIALAAAFCKQKLNSSANEVLLVSPADHIIEPQAEFAATVKTAVQEAANQTIVTFGVTPTAPETGYGYIQAGRKEGAVYVVESFKEKPDRETAEQYLAAGNYYWNSGLFAFTLELLTAEFEQHQPDIFRFMNMPVNEIEAKFGDMPDISFDYAIAEKSSKVKVIPLSARWNDIGSWDAIYDVLDKDTAGNAVRGDCLTVDCHNTLMLGQSRLLAGIGLEDLLVVETDDVILVAKRGESQKVKDVVNELKSKGRREAHEHTTTYRPWGSYTVLGEGPGYKMKRITVKPGHQLSLQLHYHRSEHWIVTGGTARVTIGDTVQMVHENESVFVPPTTKHRLENPGKVPLEIIEVQNGKYLEEDDIVRFEDIYGRS